jgi:sugar phosphate isomerase/epimerase
MKIGCQTFTWEMQRAQRPTTLWAMFDAMAAAGYDGVEFTTVTGAEWLRTPDRVGEELSSRGLQLAAVAVVRQGFTDPAGLAEDLALAETVTELLSHFPGSILAFGGAAHEDTANWQPHLDVAIRFYTEAGLRAAEAGVPSAVHPHSHFGSLLETREQYDYLFDRLPDAVGWCPDTGHILRGGQELFPCLQRYAPRIRYVHLKDVDAAGTWQPLGAGLVDLPALIRQLDGVEWLVAEEESALAWNDPAAAITANAETLRRCLR